MARILPLVGGSQGRVGHDEDACCVRGGRRIPVGSFGEADRYTVRDIGSVEGGNRAVDFLDFTIEVTGHDLVRDDGIVQSFEAIPKKDGSSIISALFQGVGELRRTVTFALSRVSLTSGGVSAIGVLPNSRRPFVSAVGA